MKSVFYDEFAMQFFYEDHSAEEECFLLLCMSSGAKAHTIGVNDMKAEYDLSKLKTRKNP